jgi:hypothetical protein
MFMKKLGVVAALMICALSASASNFRGADQVYIPVAGHLQGSSGTFISDVFLANLTADPVTVSVIYQTFGDNQSQTSGPVGIEYTDKITLQAFERKEYKDFFVSALGLSCAPGSSPSCFGQLILNGCKSGASCGADTQNENGVSPNFRSISAESRIYQVANGAPANAPTTGQLFSGIPWYNFVSQLQSAPGLDKIFITGITHTGTAGGVGTFRTNIGLINASQYSKTTLVVKLYQGRLNDTDKKGEASVTLGPLGNVQPGFAQLFPQAAFGGNYFVTVEQRNSEPTADAPSTCTSGCPAFLAYGSVLDNISGDATTLEPQYLVELNPDALVIIYPGAGKTSIVRSVRH